MSSASKARCLILLLLTILAGEARADSAIPPDKRAHFAGGALAGGIGTAIANHFVPQHRLAVGIILGSLPGLAVEIGDSTTSAGFSKTDLLADVLGATAGALVTDKWILKPVVVPSGSAKVFGLAYEHHF